MIGPQDHRRGGAATDPPSASTPNGSTTRAVRQETAALRDFYAAYVRSGVMCGRRLIGKSFFTLMQHWSGAVMCPAC
jgi:hypothetical protein